MAKKTRKATEKPVEKPTKKKAAEKPAKPTEELDLSEEMVADLQENITALHAELDKAMRFAAASKRCRKMTSELEKKFKQFRKASVNHWK
jgi:predicted RNase H-like nuclease (RuvC/YqgF family)